MWSETKIAMTQPTGSTKPSCRCRRASPCQSKTYHPSKIIGGVHLPVVVGGIGFAHRTCSPVARCRGGTRRRVMAKAKGMHGNKDRKQRGRSQITDIPVVSPTNPMVQ